MPKNDDDEKLSGIRIRTETGTVVVDEWSDFIPLDEAVRMSGLSRRQFDRLVDSGWAPQPVEHYKYKMYIKWEIDGWRVARELRKIKSTLDEMRSKIISIDIPNQRHVDSYKDKLNTFDFIKGQLSPCEVRLVNDPASKTHGVYSQKRDERKIRGDDFYDSISHCFHTIKHGRPSGSGGTGSAITPHYRY